MNYINEIFKRADIQQIRSFLMNGDECRIERGTYEERIEKAERTVYERMRKEFPENKDYEDVMGLVYCYASAVEDVYMEIGLLIGSVLSSQVYRNYAAALSDGKKD